MQLPYRQPPTRRLHGGTCYATALDQLRIACLWPRSRFDRSLLRFDRWWLRPYCPGFPQRDGDGNYDDGDTRHRRHVAACQHARSHGDSHFGGSSLRGVAPACSRSTNRSAANRSARRAARSPDRRHCCADVNASTARTGADLHARPATATATTGCPCELRWPRAADAERPQCRARRCGTGAAAG